MIKYCWGGGVKSFDNQQDIILFKRTPNETTVETVNPERILTGEIIVVTEPDKERIWTKNSGNEVVPLHSTYNGGEIEAYLFVNSNIDGGNVTVNGETVGTIVDGVASIPLDKVSPGDKISIEAGNLPTREPDYTFEVTEIQDKPIVSNNGLDTINLDDYIENIVSTKTSYAYSYPSEITFDYSNIQYSLDYIEEVQTTPIGYDYNPNIINENLTESIQNCTIVLTQHESNKTYELTLEQAEGVKSEYTINYNVEGATVLADGEDVGLISGQTLTFEKWNSNIKDTIQITFSGGVPISLPQDEYNFNVSQLNDNFSENGETKQVTVESDKTTYNWNHVTTTVKKDESVTVEYNLTNEGSNVNYSSTVLNGDGVNVSGNNITFNENLTESDREGNIQFIQNESNKEVTLSVRQNSGVKYNYTVNYNVEGATVLADGENVGAINNGSLVFEKWNNHAANSYSITFSGGTPDDLPSTAYNFSVNPTSLSFEASGGTKNVTVNSSKNVPSWSHNSGTVSRNNSVTITYEQSSSNQSLGYTTSTSGSGLSVSSNRITYANNSGDARNGTVTYTQNESRRTVRVSCSQKEADTGTVLYENPGTTGVFVAGTDYKLYTRQQWTSLSSKPEVNGVAYITNNMKVIIAVVNTMDDTTYQNHLRVWANGHGNYGTDRFSSYSSGYGKYNGYELTKHMVENTSSSDIYTAPGFVWNSFKFPTGHHGYLPSIGECYELKDLMLQANNICDGYIAGLNYWTANDASDANAWFFIGQNQMFDMGTAFVEQEKLNITGGATNPGLVVPWLKIDWK